VKKQEGTTRVCHRKVYVNIFKKKTKEEKKNKRKKEEDI